MIVVELTTMYDRMRIHYLDSLGNSIWSKRLHFSKEGLDSVQLTTGQIASSPYNGYYITGQFRNYYGPGQSNYFVINVRPDGTPAIMKTIGPHELVQLYVGEDGVYLLGPTSATFPFTDNAKNVMLAKFDLNLDFQWAKVYHAEAFEYSKSTLALAKDGTLALGYSTFGFFPVILARLDGNGDILWQKGYPFYEPQIDAMKDGSLLLATQYHFDSTGARSPKLIISKTDSLGNLPNCEVFPTCLKSNAVSLSFDTFQVESYPTDTLLHYDIYSDSIYFNFSDFCETPDPPSPEFSFPDTLCYGDSARTADTRNVLAHKVEWRLIGPSTDEVRTDSLSFGYRFQIPGQYRLRQTVWFLGCPVSFEKNIIVLGKLVAAIDKSGLVCDSSPPVALHVNSNRPLKAYLWNTFGTGSSLEIAQNGTYTVTVSDGFCPALSDSVEIVLASSLLNGKAPLTLPADTTVCGDALPFLLYPTSDFSDRFLLNNIPLESLPARLESGGEYLVSVSVEDCLFSSTFSLSVGDCETAVYFPNAFSPNNDGINDLFFPQGKNFLPLKLSIYDRWGGRLGEMEGDDAHWDGGNCGSGVYVYDFEYLDLVANKRKRLKGAVLLLK